MDESPYYRAFRMLKLPISFRQWERLPRHPAYKYEYFNDTAWISPRPKPVRARIDLREWRPPRTDEEPKWHRPSQAKSVDVRPLRESDWDQLARPFLFAFARQTPFSHLHDRTAEVLAAKSIEHTRSGKDGEVIPAACTVAVDNAPECEPDKIIGASLITFDDHGKTREPHLTWIFVSWPWQRGGIATRLLLGSVEALRERGYNQLRTTCLQGDTASLLWHWRNRFVIEPDVF